MAAAVVAAALAAAKLVADKESKISDFRGGWIQTFRCALAECLAQAHVIAGRIRIRTQHTQPAARQDSEDYSLEKELTQYWASYRRSYREVLLHLNFAETSIPLYEKELGSRHPSPGEVWRGIRSESMFLAEHLFIQAERPQQIDALRSASPAALELVSILQQLQSELIGKYERIGQEGKYARIDSLIHRATLLGNLVIKPEWNRIKRGERAHRLAIRISATLVFVGVLTLLFLISG